MVVINNWSEVIERVSRFRNKQLYVTNFYPNENEVRNWIKEQSFFVVDIDDDSSCFLHRNENMNFIHLYLKSMEIMPVALQAIRNKYPDKFFVFDWICKSDEERILLNKLINDCKFELHTSLRRMSLVLKENKYKDEDTVNYAQENDIEELHSFFHSTFDPVSERIPTKEKFQQYISLNSVLLIRNQGEIAGVAIIDIQKKTMYLKHIVTNKKFRGQGIASKLLNKAFYLSKECFRYILWVIEDNHSAIKLYKKFGYEFEALTDYTIVST